MPTGDAYSSGPLIPSYLGLAYALIVETDPYPELAVIFPDYAIRTSLGTFSILLYLEIVMARISGKVELEERTVQSGPCYSEAAESDS